MSITAILFVALYLTGLILTLRNPYFGIATYIFEWHNHPPYMWWGKPLPDLRWSFLVSVVMVISLIINYRKLKPLKKADYSVIWWMVGLTAWAYFITAYYAAEPVASLWRAGMFLKYTIQCFFMMFLIRTVAEHRTIIWVFLLNVANFGRIAFQRGSNRDLGIVAPNAGEENALSAHVAGMMPLFGFYAMFGKKWEKIASFLIIPFLVNLVILANSRAGSLAVIMTGVLALIFVKRGFRKRVALGLVGGLCLFLYLGHTSFWDRQKATMDYETVETTDARIYLWQGALKMAEDHPMGVGGRGFEQLFDNYVQGIDTDRAKDVHNTFLLALVEWGYFGLFLFCGFLLHGFWVFYKIIRDSRETPSYRYYIDSMALGLGLVGILIAGIFHTRLYAESIWWIVAIGVALRNIQVDEMETQRIAEKRGWVKI